MNREAERETERYGVHITPVRTYLLVYLGLLLLLGATLGAAYIDLGALNLPIALAIAVVKAVLVVIFFMHVRESTVLVRFFVIAGLIWLAILIGLTLSDYLTRVDPFSV